MITDADVRAKMAGFSGDSQNILPEEKRWKTFGLFGKRIKYAKMK